MLYSGNEVSEIVWKFLLAKRFAPASASCILSSDLLIAFLFLLEENPWHRIDLCVSVRFTFIPVLTNKSWGLRWLIGYRCLRGYWSLLEKSVTDGLVFHFIYNYFSRVKSVRMHHLWLIIARSQFQTVLCENNG